MMGIEQTMDLLQAKFKKAKSTKNHRYWANYRFEISKEIKDSRQKKDGCRWIIDLDLLKK